MSALVSALLPGACALLGLLVGSFLNVAAIRLPQGESLAHPPSHCDSCGHRLGPAELVPVLSWLLLGGRCRYCRSRISPMYPVGEAAACAAFLLAGLRLGPQPELLVGLFFVSMLIVVALADFRLMLIPDRVLVAALCAGVAMRLFIHPLPLWQYGAAFAAGGAVLYAIAWLGWRLTGRESMGGGDIKLFAVVGLFLGIKLTLLAVLLSSMLGALVGAALLSAGVIRRGEPMPFAPFIAAGAFAAYLWGDALIASYLSFVAERFG